MTESLERLSVWKRKENKLIELMKLVKVIGAFRLMSNSISPFSSEYISYVHRNYLFSPLKTVKNFRTLNFFGKPNSKA